MRGYFSFLAKQPGYQRAPKIWYVTIEQAQYFWYELIRGESIPVSGLSKPVERYLKGLKAQVEATLEKRFIYFIVTRPKVRVDLTRRAKWGWFLNKNVLHIPLVIGENKERIRVPITFEEDNGKRPHITMYDKYISAVWSDITTTWSIHDLLQLAGTAPQFPTTVRYVGQTHDPEQRLTRGEHANLEKIIYQLSDQCDVFLRVHTMKIGVKADVPGLCIVTTNGMVDEVPIEDEADIVERALIRYFNTKMQQANVPNDIGTLRNRLRQIRDENNIQKVIVDLELDNPNFYDALESDQVKTSWRHVFECSLGENDEPCLIRLDESFNFHKQYG